MITRLRRVWAGLATEQRRVTVAAALVLVSLLLPWYTKTTNAVTRSGLDTRHEAKMAITVPSFVEASIFLVAVAVLVLMLLRGERRAFHLPFGDGVVVTAAGAWMCFLVFYRFIDHPSSQHAQNVISDYGLSWGIFFGLLAAAFLLYSGLRLRAAAVPEPPLPGDGPRGGGSAGGPSPGGISPDDPTAISERELRRQRRAAARAARRDPAAAMRSAPAPEPETPSASPRGQEPIVATPESPAPHADREPPTQVARPTPATRVGQVGTTSPRRPQRPAIDGGEQLSFDEQE